MTTQLTRSTDRRGFALESAIIFMVLLLALVGAAVTATVMIQRTGATDYRGTRVQYAAEAGADNVMSQLQRFMQNGTITAAQLASVTAPTIQGFTYSTVTAQTVGAAVAQTITTGTYKGLFGLNQRIDLNIEARDSLANRSNVIVSVNAQSIPLFQFGVFYSGDLEIANGQPLTFAGRIHTNGNLYLTSPATTNYTDVVTTAQGMYRRRKYLATGPDCPGCVFIANAAGTLNVLNFDTQSAPTASQFIGLSHANFDDRLQTSVYGVTQLTLPLPSGVPVLAITQPKSGSDTPAAQGVKMSWKATMTVTVNTTRDTTTGVFCANTPVSGVTMNSTDCNNIFTIKPNAFRDSREYIGVDLLQIDMNKLMAWIVTNANAPTIVYVEFDNAVLPGTVSKKNDFPAVRLINGDSLRVPFTIATDREIYVQGPFNNRNTWRPAAIMGDAITLLSRNWSDASAPWLGTENPSTPASATPAYYAPVALSADTVYAAISAGNSVTPCDVVLSSCPASNPYGGGLENFPRLLESWNGATVMYRGSLVSLYTSAYANRNSWNWQPYYSAPTRDWAFDTRFRDPSQLPPGTPVVGNVSEVGFRPVY